MVVEVLHQVYQKIQSEWDDYIGELKQENWMNPEFVPLCLSLCLRTCTIRDFAYLSLQLQHHLMLAEYILKNARVLQTMTIWSDKELPEIETKLSSYPRASANVNFQFFDYIEHM